MNNLPDFFLSVKLCIALEAGGGPLLSPLKLYIDMCIVYVSLRVCQLRDFVVTLYCKMDLKELGCEGLNRIRLGF